MERGKWKSDVQRKTENVIPKRYNGLLTSGNKKPWANQKTPRPNLRRCNMVWALV
jgi:hypothetical protein